MDTAFCDAIRIAGTSGQVELPQPAVLPGLAAAPPPPSAGKAVVYARDRAGAPCIHVMRPSGRDFPLQQHFGVNRIANWSPFSHHQRPGPADHLGRHREVMTLFIAAPPNGSFVCVRVVDGVSGAVFEQERPANLPAATQFLSPGPLLNTGATAAALAYDCAPVYLKTDFRALSRMEIRLAITESTTIVSE